MSQRWITTGAARLSLWVVAVWGLMACAESATEVDSCVPGQQIACACAGGGSGVQRCDPFGVFEACDCSSPFDPDGGGGGSGDADLDSHTGGSADGDDASGNGPSADGRGGGDAHGATGDAVGGGPGSDASAPGDDGAGEGGDGAEGDAGGSPINPTPGCYLAPGMAPTPGSPLKPPPFPLGSLPGEPCGADEDCLYGLCTDQTVITQGKLSVCVKKCAGCGSVSPACAWDNEGDVRYTCVKQQFAGEFNDHCARQCGSLSDCAELSSDYSSCNANSAGHKYCGGW